MMSKIIKVLLRRLKDSKLLNLTEKSFQKQFVVFLRAFKGNLQSLTALFGSLQENVMWFLNELATLYI